MKAIKLIVSVGLAAMLLGGCSKVEHSLTEIDKQMIPYKMGDTVRFINVEGVPSVLTVVEDETYWEKYSGGGRGGQIDLYETRKVRLKSESDGICFTLSVEADDKTVYIHMDPYGSFGFVIRYNPDGSISNEKVEINGKTYRNVKIAENYDWGSGFTMQLYYNIEYGILQVKRQEKTFFTIVTEGKKWRTKKENL